LLIICHSFRVFLALWKLEKALFAASSVSFISVHNWNVLSGRVHSMRFCTIQYSTVYLHCLLLIICHSFRVFLAVWGSHKLLLAESLVFLTSVHKWNVVLERVCSMRFYTIQYSSVYLHCLLLIICHRFRVFLAVRRSQKALLA